MRGITRARKGSELHEAFADLYSACGSPAPRVLVADGSREFSRFRGIYHPNWFAEDYLDELMLLVATLLLAYGSYEAVVWAFALAGTSGLGLVFGASISFLVMVSRMVQRRRNSLLGAVTVSRCMRSAGCGSMSGNYVGWGDPELFSPRDERTPEFHGTVSTLVDGAKSLTDMALLGDTLVLVVPRGRLAERKAIEALPKSYTDKEYRKEIGKLLQKDAPQAQAALEGLGMDLVMRVTQTKPVASDDAGTLWQLVQPHDGNRMRWLQVTDPATGGDNWIPVPVHVCTPREAVAWTYGMGPAAYAPTMEG